MSSPVYLDCNATTPLEPDVRDVLIHYLTEDFGNEGSRTHEFGTRAKQAVQRAREQVSSAVGAKRDEVIFTSGATESNNLATLGLAHYGRAVGKLHLISSKIEHKAVIEPLEAMASDGFEVTWLDSDDGGRVTVEQLREALRPDTLLVSVMAANNETGVVQPLEGICEVLKGHPAYFHTDAAQAFGKVVSPLQNERIDLISVSGHKIFGPKGVGALIARRRSYDRPPLRPLLLGGGQERGLRPGTLPVALIASLGMAAETAMRDSRQRWDTCLAVKTAALAALLPLKPRIHGRDGEVMSHVLNLAFPGLDSEALIVALKDLISISNGSACTSSSYKPSHVIKAMGFEDDEANEAVRLSWCHLTPAVDWDLVAARIAAVR